MTSENNAFDYECPLSNLYIRLSKMKISEHIDELDDLVSETRRFIFPLSYDEKEDVRKIKESYDKFLTKMAGRKHNKEVKKKLGELKKFWEIAADFYQFDADKNQKKREKVDSAKLCLEKLEGKLNDEIILKSLKIVGLRYCRTKKDLVMDTLKMINENVEDWEIKFYTYDDKKKCGVIFTNGKYFVDHYGNFYLEKETCFEFLRLLTESAEFRLENEERPFYAFVNPFEKFLEEIKKTLESVNKEFAFSNFVTDTLPHESLFAFLQLKSFSRFFCELDDLCKKERVYFGIKGSKLFTISKNLVHLETSTKGFVKTYHNFHNILEEFSRKITFEAFSFDTIPFETIPFATTVSEIVKDVTTEDINRLIEDSSLKDAETDYFNICFSIAKKLLEAVEKETKIIMIKDLSANDVKFVALWVATKFKDTAEALIKFTMNMKQYSKEFCSLITTVIKCEKSEKHKFLNTFSAAYHFAKHYSPIRVDYINNRALKRAFPGEKTLPSYDAKTKNECAKFFFKFLPDFIFETPSTTKDGYCDGHKGRFYCYEKFKIFGKEFQKSEPAGGESHNVRSNRSSINEEKFIVEIRYISSSTSSRKRKVNECEQDNVVL